MFLYTENGVQKKKKKKQKKEETSECVRANVTEQKEKKTRMFDVQGESERVTNLPVIAIYACTFLP